MSRRPALDLANHPGARSLGINLDALGLATIALATRKARRKAPKLAAPSRLYEPGTVVASFVVEGRAVPWSVAHRGQSNPKLVEWQKEVKAEATKAMGGRLPHSGRFELRATFEIVRRGPVADLTNVVKGLEDSLQGIIVVNDSQTIRHLTSKNDDAKANIVCVEVIAL